MYVCMSSSSGMKKADDSDDETARAVQTIRRQLEDYAGSGQQHHAIDIDTLINIHT